MARRVRRQLYANLYAKEAARAPLPSERNAFEGLSPWREVRVLIIDLEYMSGARVLIVRCLYCASCFNRTVSVVYSCVARARVCML